MNPGIVSALAAAALFGASTPLAKSLVGEVHHSYSRRLFECGQTRPMGAPIQKNPWRATPRGG
jgi:hypothetical protein